MLVRIARLSVSFMAALWVSLALFLFMQRLISQPVPTLPDVQMSGFVELFQPPPDPQTNPEPEEPPPPPQEPEATSTVLDVAPAAAAMALDAADFAVAPGEFTLPTPNAASSVQVAVADDLLQDFGDDTRQGFVEITPFTTRRPNIPDIAFEHQLNGWVLVIFNVTPAGKTRNIKVLDAQPKGIFEQEVLRAIAQWRYDVTGLISDGQDVVLTQKIQLNWQSFSDNLPYSEDR